jgi:hypothetical protein
VLKSYRTPIAVIAALVCFILLFAGGPEANLGRSMMGAWNLGHILAFALWPYLLMRFWPPVAQWSCSRQWLWVMGLAAAFGIAVEVGQSFIGRMAEISDVVKDLTGCALALAFWAPSRRQMPLKILRGLQIFVLVLLFVQIMPFVRALSDEAAAMEQFPALGTFESPFELDRWKGSAALSIDRQIKAQGQASLKIEMDTKEYSGAALHYCPRDWRGHTRLQFRVFNPSLEPLQMTCTVTDFKHNRDGYQYDDRFNQRLTIKPGWNRFVIAMQQIEDAPRGRRLNLQEINGFGIFATRLPAPRTIYLDDLRLMD